MMSNNEKINKADIDGLPDGAMIQTIRGMTYVFFAYCYNLDGKRHQERDYIGTVKDMNFVPNDYYVDHKPKRNQRPLKNWTNPKKAKIEKMKARAQTIKTTPPDINLDETHPFERSAGASALVAKVLLDTGMAKDVYEVLDGDFADTLGVLNLGMHAALTGQATYLAGEESYVQKLIGKGAPTSQRASELHAKIGRIEGADRKIGERRSSRIRSGELLALDGTRLNCDSDGIELSAIGKRKDGTFGRQVNFSVLFNATRGEAVSYRVYSGNFNDISTLSDFRAIWKEYGIADRSARLILDRGYFSEKELLRLTKDGFNFLVGAKTHLKNVRRIIEERNSEFYDMDSLLRNRRFYGLYEDSEIVTAEGRSDVRFYVYRSPEREMDETNRLLEELDELERKWQKRKLSVREEELLAQFYDNPKAGKPLERNTHAVREHCFTLGFFAMAGNEKRTSLEALNDYDYRNEVEVFFREHMGQLRSTRVQTMETLNGALFTTFVGTSIVTNILHRMRLKDNEGRELRMQYTVASLLKCLQKVHLIRDADGSLRLTNVTSKEKSIVAKLGFPGLFDSAQEVDRLLSASNLKASII